MGFPSQACNQLWALQSPARTPVGCSLSISIYPYIFNMGLKFYDRIPFELYIRPQLSSYLDSVLGGLKWHMENNKPTPKNHFGTHKWFSK